MGCCGGFGSFFGPRHREDPPQSRPENQKTPLDLLKERLAQGEITIDEYRKLANVLAEVTPAK